MPKIRQGASGVATRLGGGFFNGPRQVKTSTGDPAQLAKVRERVCASLIGKTGYTTAADQQMVARAGLALLGIYPGQHTASQLNSILSGIKSYNPSIKLGFYTNVVEVNPNLAGSEGDFYSKCLAANWMLKTVAGAELPSRVFAADHDTNFLIYTAADGNGQRLPQWLAQRDYDKFLAGVTDGLWDIWYHDNTNWRSRQYTPANWKLDGVDRNAQTDTELQTAFRVAMAAWWDACRALKPSLEHFGNPDLFSDTYPGNWNSSLGHPEYNAKLEGAYFENATWGNWDSMMTGYADRINRCIGPKRGTLRVADGSATGNTNYAWMRYGLASALMLDGYYSYTGSGAYTTFLDFDEYEIRLGSPLQSDYSSSGNLRYRRYEGGLAVVNADPSNAIVFDPLTVSGGPYFRFNAAAYSNQDPATNNGSGGSFSLAAKDGRILVK